MHDENDEQKLQEYKEYMQKKIDEITLEDTIIFAFASPKIQDCKVTFTGYFASVFALLRVINHSIVEEFPDELNELTDALSTDAEQTAPSTKTLQ